MKKTIATIVERRRRSLLAVKKSADLAGDAAAESIQARPLRESDWTRGMMLSANLSFSYMPPGHRAEMWRPGVCVHSGLAKFFLV